MSETHYRLPESLRDGLLAYLGKRPLDEVVTAWDALRRLGECPGPADPLEPLQDE